jgi:hypothetical protein
VIGPYLIYSAFASWFFRQSPWLTGLIALWGIVVCVFAVFDVRKARELKNSQEWPTVDGQVISVSRGQDENGFPKLTITYTYKVNYVRYGGSESLVFKDDREAARFEALCRAPIKLHYRLDKPQNSVFAREAMR